jgi:hypothetical protein
MEKTRGGGGALWTVAGAVVLIVCLLVLLRLRNGPDPVAQLAFRAQRIDLVQRMEADLAAASTAEKSAVLAVTDEDSRTFADQARASSARVAEERADLAALLGTGGTDDERALLHQFTIALGELQRVDEDLLGLAVKNTNVKAYALAYGPAATSVDGMNAALARIVLANENAPEAKTVLLSAFGAQTSALHILTLLPPHIAEESDGKMDALEAAMAQDEAAVATGLRDLTALPRLRADPDLATAAQRYAELRETKTKILALSRENTNVRSLSISLNRKRSVALACETALTALLQSLEAEPVPKVAPVWRGR